MKKQEDEASTIKTAGDEEVKTKTAGDEEVKTKTAGDEEVNTKTAGDEEAKTKAVGDEESKTKTTEGERPKIKKSKGKKKKKSGRWLTILLIVVLLVGMVLLIYPSASNWWNQRIQSRAIAGYNDVVELLANTEQEEMLAAAEAYNESLRTAGVSAFYNPELVEGYEDTLDITGTGIMGYVTIEKINVNLPIYHGTSVDVLQVAAGHLEGTSLPIGGESTHAVIMAHRGLPSTKLFTDLNELVIGDTFTITILNEVLTYEIDQILIVEPTDVSELQIVEGEDYVTLLTCTPYGVNSHRLLVRGHRIETEEVTDITVTGDAYKIDFLVVAPFVAAVLLIIPFLWLIFRPGKRKRRKKSEKDVILTPGECEEADRENDKDDT